MGGSHRACLWLYSKHVANPCPSYLFERKPDISHLQEFRQYCMGQVSDQSQRHTTKLELEADLQVYLRMWTPGSTSIRRYVMFNRLGQHHLRQKWYDNLSEPRSRCQRWKKISTTTTKSPVPTPDSADLPTGPSVKNCRPRHGKLQTIARTQSGAHSVLKWKGEL